LGRGNMDYVEKRKLILEGNINKVILSLATPIMLNNIIQTTYNLADTYWVSKMGDIQVGATAFVWPVIYLVISLGMGINVAGTALISQYIGANEKEKGRDVAGQIVSFALIFSLVLVLIGYGFTPNIVRFMGAEGELFENSKIYLSVMFFDIPFLFITSIFTAIRQAQGDTVIPMIINAGGAVLNIILDPIFIFTFNMGIAGAAIATVLSKAVFTIYIAFALFKKNDGIYLTYNHLKIKPKLLKKILKVGVPSSLGQSGEALGFIVLNMFIVSFGDDVITAFGLGNRINSIFMMPAMGIGGSLASIVGQNMGAGNMDRVKKAFKSANIMSVSILIVGGIIMFFTSTQLLSLFSKSPNILKEGSYYLKILAIASPLMGIFQVCVGTFQGSGHTLYVMIMELTRLWLIRIPLIVIFKNYTNFGSASVWYAMVISNLVICIIGILLYRSGKWQKKVTE
jgi:putative MATE family efflux protein